MVDITPAWLPCPFCTLTYHKQSQPTKRRRKSGSHAASPAVILLLQADALMPARISQICHKCLPAIWPKMNWDL
jgi:hypothetical protein